MTHKEMTSCGYSVRMQEVDNILHEGGDKFVFGNEAWLVVAVPEIGSDWRRVIGCMQVM